MWSGMITKPATAFKPPSGSVKLDLCRYMLDDTAKVLREAMSRAEGQTTHDEVIVSTTDLLWGLVMAEDTPAYRKLEEDNLISSIKAHLTRSADMSIRESVFYLDANARHACKHDPGEPSSLDILQRLSDNTSCGAAQILCIVREKVIPEWKASESEHFEFEEMHGSVKVAAGKIAAAVATIVGAFLADVPLVVTKITNFSLNWSWGEADSAITKDYVEFKDGRVLIVASFQKSKMTNKNALGVRQHVLSLKAKLYRFEPANRQAVRECQQMASLKGQMLMDRLMCVVDGPTGGEVDSHAKRPTSTTNQNNGSSSLISF